IADHLGIEFKNRHRAMADADAAREVFSALRAQLAASPPEVLIEADRIASSSDWALRHLFRELAEEHPRSGVALDDTELTRGFVKRPEDIGDPVVPASNPIRVAPEEPARLIASSAASSGMEAFEE